jgi:cytochrome bd-type quinol oxidase subunit 2
MTVPVLSSSVESLYLRCYNQLCMLILSSLSVVFRKSRRSKCGATWGVLAFAGSGVHSSHPCDSGTILFF